MALFTIIVGSAYPGASDEVAYIVEAVNPEYGIIQAETVFAGHNSGRCATYFCMEGVSTFYRKSPVDDPVKVVDLRQPDPPVIGVACTEKEINSLIEGLKGLTGVMYLPGRAFSMTYFVRPPHLTHDEMAMQVKDILARINFTMSETTLSKAQATIRSSDKDD